MSKAHKAGFEFCSSRAVRSISLAAFLLFVGSQGLEKAVAGGETRTITLHHVHTNENITITYKKDGQFDDAALKKLNWFLRDWRKAEDVRMAPHLIDLLWEVQQEFGGKTIDVVCGYRAPETNAMLRARSTGVARTSLHMQGKATDFFIPGVPVEQIRNAALRIQGGGVGYYPTSGSPFVHMDVGSVRHWPRMTRQQLVRVFPDGRTIHVPSDGTPLQGYQLALADGERTLHGGSNRPKQRNLLASLFSRGQDQEEADDVASAQPTRGKLPSSAVTAYAAPVAPAPEVIASSIPLPPHRPILQLASLESKPAPAPKPMYEIASAESRPAPTPRGVKSLDEMAALTPNQIITERGYWQGLPEAAQDLALTPVSTDARATGPKFASADPAATASSGLFNRKDHVSPNVALTYAAQAEKLAAEANLSAPPRTVPAIVTTHSAATIAMQPAVANNRTNDRLNDPWIRGVLIAPSIVNSLVTTTFGAPDLTSLRPFLQKPAAAVMMTFSQDPHLGMTTDRFTGNAVVFQATVTFNMRTAALQ